jgi:cyclophilin family peptidyl-prolyl cis-trans isomerase
MDVVNKIAKTPTAPSGMHQNLPKDAVVIKSATIVAAAK